MKSKQSPSLSGLEPEKAASHSPPHAVQVVVSPVQKRAGRGPSTRTIFSVVFGIAAVAGGVAYFAASNRKPDSPNQKVLVADADEKVKAPAGGIPVNTIKPRRKTLERTLEQPGSIKPWSQAELYAKTSGYLKTIRRDVTPSLAGHVVSQRLVGVESPLACTGNLAAAFQAGWLDAPQIDIGSVVARGEMLFEIANPERDQDIVEKRTIVRQREAELEAARTGLATFEATMASYKAQILQARAEVRRYESEYAFRNKEWTRLKELVQSRTVQQEIADEKQHQVNSALGGWESALAKVQTVQADLEVVSSKLATARADIKVKEALVQYARDEVNLAHILADYSRVYAPFDGIITYRGVDEGDFVQNATSGQSRKLMTITALDRLKVIIQVPDSDASYVQVGAEATLSVNSQKVKQGRVARMAHALDPQTRTMQAEIDLDNRDRHLLPGMYGRVTVTLQKIPNAQAVPATAVYSRKGQNFILEVVNGIARRHPVKIRFDDGKEMEVAKLVGNEEIPLDGSEELIVSNKGEIADGQKVATSLLTASLSDANADSIAEERNDAQKNKVLATAPLPLGAKSTARAVAADGMSPSPTPSPG